MSDVQFTLKFQYRGARAGQLSLLKNHDPPTREYMDELHRDLSILGLSSPSRLDGCWQSGTVECIWYAVEGSEFYKKLVRGYSRRNRLINGLKYCIKWIQLNEVNLGDSTPGHSSSSSGPGKVSPRLSSSIYIARKSANELSRPITRSRSKHESSSSSSHQDNEGVTAALDQAGKMSEDIVPWPAWSDGPPSPVRQIMSLETIDRLDRTQYMLRRLSESEDAKGPSCLASSEIANLQEGQPPYKSRQIFPQRIPSVPATPSDLVDDPLLVVKNEMSASPSLPAVEQEEAVSSATHGLGHDGPHQVGEGRADKHIAPSGVGLMVVDSPINSQSDVVIEQMQNKLEMLQAKLQNQHDARRAAEGSLQDERQRRIQAESTLNDQLQSERGMRQIAEAALQVERQHRVQAEKVIEDMRRECHAPFVVPALMDAFVKLAQLTSEAVP